MPSYLQFMLEAMLISLSGVMAPGPITATTIGEGSESPESGSLIAIGHGLFEFPLMIVLFLGFGYVFNLMVIKTAVGILGGGFLAFMGIGMLKTMGQTDIRSRKNHHHPVVTGILLSAGNPYFLIWWATIGVALILKSVQFGIVGFLVFAVCHWLCDFIWYTFLSHLAFRGKRFFGQKFQKFTFAVCGIALIFFSVKFIYDAVKIHLI